MGTIVTRGSLLIDTDHVYSDTIMTDSKKRTQHKDDCKYTLFIFYILILTAHISVVLLSLVIEISHL